MHDLNPQLPPEQRPRSKSNNSNNHNNNNDHTPVDSQLLTPPQVPTIFFLAMAPEFEPAAS